MLNISSDEHCEVITLVQVSVYKMQFFVCMMDDNLYLISVCMMQFVCMKYGNLSPILCSIVG